MPSPHPSNPVENFSSDKLIRVCLENSRSASLSEKSTWQVGLVIKGLNLLQEHLSWEEVHSGYLFGSTLMDIFNEKKFYWDTSNWYILALGSSQASKQNERKISPIINFQVQPKTKNIAPLWQSGRKLQTWNLPGVQSLMKLNDIIFSSTKLVKLVAFNGWADRDGCFFNPTTSGVKLNVIIRFKMWHADFEKR